MTEAALLGRLDEMHALGPDWDGCGSHAPSPSMLARASRLAAELNCKGIMPYVSAITVCPEGCPLFDIERRRVRVSIACTEGGPWVASVTSHGATIMPCDPDDLPALAALVAAALGR